MVAEAGGGQQSGGDDRSRGGGGSVIVTSLDPDVVAEAGGHAGQEAPPLGRLHLVQVVPRGPQHLGGDTRTWGGVCKDHAHPIVSSSPSPLSPHRIWDNPPHATVLVPSQCDHVPPSMSPGPPPCCCAVSHVVLRLPPPPPDSVTTVSPRPPVSPHPMPPWCPRLSPPRSPHVPVSPSMSPPCPCLSLMSLPCPPRPVPPFVSPPCPHYPREPLGPLVSVSPHPPCPPRVPTDPHVLASPCPPRSPPSPRPLSVPTGPLVPVSPPCPPPAPTLTIRCRGAGSTRSSSSSRTTCFRFVTRDIAPLSRQRGEGSVR